MRSQDREHLSLLLDIGELAALITESSDIHQFLQKTARMVSRHLAANVCSIYLYEENRDELVLTTTLGLNPGAVQKVRMRPGEGLVGATFARNRPVCEGVAGESPQFKYFPETDEDRFNSFIAVPIRRGIERVGVLVVQHEDRDYFDEIDVKALRAVASQLAGAIGNARLMVCLTRFDTCRYGEQAPAQPLFLKGKAASQGVAWGPALVFDRSHSRLLDEEPSAASPHTLKEFHRAVDATVAQLERYQRRLSDRLPESASLIFAAHVMILKDEKFIGEMVARIVGGMAPAEAVRSVARRYMALFSASHHGYLQEKAHDIKDLAGRLLNNLFQPTPEKAGWFEERIIISRQLYPSEMLRFGIEGVRGIVLVGGGLTSHVAILARSMLMPLVIVDRPELMRVPEGTTVLLDGDIGNVYVRPGEKIIRRFRERQASARVAPAPGAAGQAPRACTRDGVRVHLLANINLLGELAAARELAAEGVGLYRTEFPFLIRAAYPSEEEQYVVYRRLFEEMAGRPVTIRTLDAGGEKMLSYSEAGSAANPELGLRSIRFSLRHRDVFLQQLRAILRAAEGAATLRIMFPLVSSLDEFAAAQEVVHEAARQLAQEGAGHHSAPQVGIMVELPSVLEIIDEMAGAVDFFSIGSNDFVQYMLAVDRGNDEVAEYYQPFHPSVLRGLARISTAARSARKYLAICGEMAHDPTCLRFLVGIGIRNFSLDPQFLPRIQKEVAGLEVAAAENFARGLLAEATIAGVQRRLRVAAAAGEIPSAA
ncbi:MAG: phosphoenolpyruvate--protein phosphotransferase [Desulfobacteraceae bacterium]|jgi:phosphotransferase system enzyme I (PtsP)